MLYDDDVCNNVYDGKEVLNCQWVCNDNDVCNGNGNGDDLGLALCVAAEFALLALQTLSIKLIEHIFSFTCKGSTDDDDCFTCK